jgi:branched-chain amino acid transport system ATP-binding protein
VLEHFLGVAGAAGSKNKHTAGTPG